MTMAWLTSSVRNWNGNHMVMIIRPNGLSVGLFLPLIRRHVVSSGIVTVAASSNVHLKAAFLCANSIHTTMPS